MTLFEFLAQRSKGFIIVAAALIALGIGSLDVATGGEISFSVFYLIPVSLVAWFAGRRAGIVISLESAFIWRVADTLGGRVYSSSAIPYWNMAVRFVFFLIVTLILASLRHAQAARNAMTQFIVHDLRSPLSNIITSLGYLLETEEFPLVKEQKLLVRTGLTSGQRMMTHINSLLDLGKLESGKMTLNLQVVDLRDLVSQAVQQMDSIAALNYVIVSTHIQRDVRTISVDADLIVRVLVNLLSNAFKYSPAHSTVTLKAERQPDGGICVSVTDQGRGVPAQWKERIFDSYSQVDVRQGGIAGGTGLGLPFCRRAVEAHGGRIWLETTAPAGASIVFTLPATTSTE